MIDMEPARLWESLLECLYPPRCCLCADLLAPGGPRWFCADCLEKLVYIEKPVCEKCGGAMEREGAACELCRGRAFAFERNVSLFAYKDDVRRAIHRFKFHDSPRTGEGFGVLMADMFAREFAGRVDILAPVPMYGRKRMRRGYNQAAVLAGQIAKGANLPLAEGLIIRRKDTKPQFELSPGDRESNLRGAFFPGPQASLAKGARVLLVDDIFTTGSTAHACAAELMTAGARAVHVMTLSHAGQNNDGE